MKSFQVISILTITALRLNVCGQVPMITNEVQKAKLDFAYTNKYGDVFTNLTVERVLPEGLLVRHEAGVAKVQWGELPKDVRAKYEPEAVNAAKKEYEAGRSAAAFVAREQQEKRAADQKWAKVNAEREANKDVGTTAVITGEVIQVTNDGLLMSLDRSNELCLLKHHPNQASLTDGKRVSIQAFYAGPYQYTTVTGAGKTIRSFDVNYPRPVSK